MAAGKVAGVCHQSAVMGRGDCQQAIGTGQSSHSLYVVASDYAAKAEADEVELLIGKKVPVYELGQLFG